MGNNQQARTIKPGQCFTGSDTELCQLARKAQAAGAAFGKLGRGVWSWRRWSFDMSKGVYRRDPDDKLINSFEYTDIPPGHILDGRAEYVLAEQMRRDGIEFEREFYGVWEPIRSPLWLYRADTRIRLKPEEPEPPQSTLLTFETFPRDGWWMWHNQPRDSYQTVRILDEGVAFSDEPEIVMSWETIARCMKWSFDGLTDWRPGTLEGVTKGGES